MVSERSETTGGLGIEWGATHRNGLCEKCHVPFEEYDTGKTDDLGAITVKKCPLCGGNTGELISRQVSIEPPAAPTCLRLSCLLRYLRDAIFFALLANYEERRITYAEANRRKLILERYRTGEPLPNTIWQAIHANIKLACPVCRRYNVDPLRGR